MAAAKNDLAEVNVHAGFPIEILSMAGHKFVPELSKALLDQRCIPV
jgi:hypothetical protein